MSSIQTNAFVRAQQVEIGKLKGAMRFWSFGLMVSGIVGVFCGVTGLLINLLFLIGISENNGLMGLLAVCLLVLAFPMLWLTAHCLDRIDSIDKARRREYCRQHGLDDREIPLTHN